MRTRVVAVLIVLGALLVAPPAARAAVIDAGPFRASVGTPSVVPNRASVPVYPWMPDGHISVLADGPGRWIMFWAEFENYRTVGTTPFPEDQTVREPSGRVFGGRDDPNRCGWDNGGSWLMRVFRLSGSRLVAYYHAEDWWCGADLGKALWASVAVTYSEDNGRTWAPGRQIITSATPRPATPVFGGAGDNDVVYDAYNRRWICYYHDGGRLHMAASYDPAGAPGTWRKWDGTGFTVPGIGGADHSIDAFLPHEGHNPSVTWNGYLDRWVMVYAGWDGRTYLSSSVGLLNWTPPVLLLAPAPPYDRIWYPTLIGDGGDQSSGRDVRLYYARMRPGTGVRDFMSVPITFTA
ncbi:hypothetical protein ACFO1B_54430 [Dactylosporangium siamense]|uniref:DUF4185 domain-containing protein n=1 Tax=Dactylosporangium siamense TaxID=685454 RepID=A0A919Q136_9ACTN|nr:hypothetical protein [Dactylosporangium siamense]GIG52956.1 hypothetical protein Dsi01nite_109970 [Dactylosporangium siamense]